MGSYFEINDTLQLTKEQGFPEELDYDIHKNSPLPVEDFKDKVFEFKDKPDIRIYHIPPVRVFLVENIEGKWLYWGLAQILEITHDYINKTTSGKFKIEYIYTPLEMKSAYPIVDRRDGKNYFASDL